MIKLTIIIPHYNTPELLINLLSSIPSLPWIETIIVDDKSQESLSLVNKFISNHQEQNIILLNNTTEKKGAGVCRNIALEKAKGKYVLFSDADDFFLEGFETAVIPYLKGKFEVIFFYPTSIYIDTKEEAGRHLKFKSVLDMYISNPNENNLLKLRYDIPNPVSKVIKKIFIDKNNIRFDETLVSNDVMFSTKVGHNMSSFTISKEIIYCITRGANSLTTTVNENIFDTRFGVFINYVNYLKKRLKKSEFRVLKISGIHHLLRSRKYGFKKILSTIMKLRKNKIRLFLISSIKLSKLFNLAGKIRKEGKYYSHK